MSTLLTAIDVIGEIFVKQTYIGSCHCKCVRYEADIDLNENTYKCNCSICLKARHWLALIKPEAFRLLAGESDLTDYQFHHKIAHHLFCKHCGIHSFGWGEDPMLGGTFYSINLNCLDNVTPEELINAPVVYVDGQNDNFQATPAETRHL